MRESREARLKSKLIALERHFENVTFFIFQPWNNGQAQNLKTCQNRIVLFASRRRRRHRRFRWRRRRCLRRRRRRRRRSRRRRRLTPSGEVPFIQC